jgi:parallel beta-helix repeat protein
VLSGFDFGGGNVSTSFYVAANDVTLDGFVVQGNTSTGTYGAGIVIAPSVAGTHIVNNIIQNNVSGLFLANNSSTNAALVQHNVFRNNNNAGEDGGRGIYSNGGLSGGNLTNVTIDSNFFAFNYGGAGTTTLEAAISLESRTLNSQSDIRITNNTFNNNGKAALFYNASGILLQGNTVTACRDQWSGAFRFEGLMSDVSILSNTLYGNLGAAVRVDSKAIEGSVSSNFVVSGNNIYGNGINSNHEGLMIDAGTYTGMFGATNSWWGSASGPKINGSGGGDAIVASGTSVLYSPFATTIFPITSPAYTGLPSSPDANIQFEDFDHGGEGLAYHDLDTANNGGQKYRGASGVDIQTTTDAGGGYNLGYVKAGEWLNYTVAIPFDGLYALQVRVANAASGGAFHLQDENGVNLTGKMTVPNSGGFQTWKTILSSVNLTAATHTLRVVFDANSTSGSVGNFNWWQLIAPALPTIPAVPADLIATPIDATTIKLTWSDVSGESEYRIERSTDGVMFAPLATVAANQTGYSDSSVSGSATFYYRVLAANSVGVSDPSNVASAAPMQPPAAPSGLSAVADGSKINLSWTDNAPAVQKSFAIFRSTDGVSFAQIGITLGTTTYSDSTGLSPATQYFYKVQASNGGGASDFSNVASATTAAATLPSGWSDGDIGAVSAAGSASFANGAYTVNGSGSDIWGSSDSFHFVYRQLTGDGTIIARVDGMTKTNGLAKAGVMFRDSLAANAKQAGVFVTPSSGVTFVRRSTTGGSSTSTSVSGPVAPYWVKLVRSGNTFTSYRSSNGTTWTLVGSSTIGMNSTIYVGLAVCAKNTTGWLNTSTFSNVSVG